MSLMKYFISLPNLVLSSQNAQFLLCRCTIIDFEDAINRAYLSLLFLFHLNNATYSMDSRALECLAISEQNCIYI